MHTKNIYKKILRTLRDTQHIKLYFYQSDCRSFEIVSNYDFKSEHKLFLVKYILKNILSPKRITLEILVH